MRKGAEMTEIYPSIQHNSRSSHIKMLVASNTIKNTTYKS